MIITMKYKQEELHIYMLSLVCNLIGDDSEI